MFTCVIVYLLCSFSRLKAESYDERQMRLLSEQGSEEKPKKKTTTFGNAESYDERQIRLMNEAEGDFSGVRIEMGLLVFVVDVMCGM